MNRRSKYWYLWIGIIILSLINISINILRIKEDKVSSHSEDKIQYKNEQSGFELSIDQGDFVIKPEGERYISNLKLAYEGRMDHTEEIIGGAAEQYISHPTMISYFLGGLLVKEEEVFILTNGYFDTDGKVVTGDVVRIAREDAYGIKNGMSMDEVENILGEPDYIIDYSLNPVSELYGTNTCSYYETGDYEVIIEFDRWVKKVIKVHLSGSNLNPGYPTANWIAVDYLSLTDEELETYNKFKEDYNEEVLRELEPMAIMKLYLHASAEKDYETEWELYIKGENQMGWDKEYHMNILASDRKNNYSNFENPVNINVNYDTNDAVITWEDKKLKQYDYDGRPFIFGFNLTRNNDGIWKVSFLPMQ